MLCLYYIYIDIIIYTGSLLYFREKLVGKRRFDVITIWPYSKTLNCRVHCIRQDIEYLSVDPTRPLLVSIDFQSATTTMMTLRKLCLCLILASLFLAARGDETVGGFKEEIGDALGGVYEKGKNLYDNLPPGGKFAAGAGAGFVGSRVAVNGATSAVKVAGAAFIV